MTRLAEDYERRSLFARVAELERERGDARDQVRALIKLHYALSEVAIERRPERVARLILSAAHDPLEFGRALFIDLDGGAARVSFESTSQGEVVRPFDVLEMPAGGAIARVLSGVDAYAAGRAGELGAPLVDTRGWYVLVGLRRSDGIFGMLYLDGHRSDAPREWDIGLVQTLATIASVALENADLFARLEALAERDPLTGLLNRRAFGARLAQALDAARRSSRALAFAIIDVDNFKAINDSRGHAFGDEVLKRLADALARHCRAHDIAARFAGDEFVVMLVDIDPALARAMIERLSLALSSEGIRCSIGVSLYPRDASDPEGLLESSDRALYLAKARGKNTYAFVGDALGVR